MPADRPADPNKLAFQIVEEATEQDRGEDANVGDPKKDRPDRPKPVQDLPQDRAS